MRTSEYSVTCMCVTLVELITIKGKAYGNMSWLSRYHWSAMYYQESPTLFQY